MISRCMFTDNIYRHNVYLQHLLTTFTYNGSGAASAVATRRGLSGYRHQELDSELAKLKDELEKKRIVRLSTLSSILDKHYV